MGHLGTTTHTHITASSPSDLPTTHTHSSSSVPSICLAIVPAPGHYFSHPLSMAILLTSSMFLSQDTSPGPCLLCQISISVCTWKAGAQTPGASSPGVRCFYEAHLGSCPESRSSAVPHCHPGREGWGTEAEGIPGRLSSEPIPAIDSGHLPLPQKPSLVNSWLAERLPRDGLAGFR